MGVVFLDLWANTRQLCATAFATAHCRLSSAPTMRPAADVACVQQLGMSLLQLV
jgi:hypothetical protein